MWDLDLRARLKEKEFFFFSCFLSFFILCRRPLVSAFFILASSLALLSATISTIVIAVGFICRHDSNCCCVGLERCCLWLSPTVAASLATVRLGLAWWVLPKFLLFWLRMGCYFCVGWKLTNLWFLHVDLSLAVVVGGWSSQARELLATCGKYLEFF